MLTYSNFEGVAFRHETTTDKAKAYTFESRVVASRFAASVGGMTHDVVVNGVLLFIVEVRAYVWASVVAFTASPEAILAA